MTVNICPVCSFSLSLFNIEILFWLLPSPVPFALHRIVNMNFSVSPFELYFDTLKLIFVSKYRKLVFVCLCPNFHK